MLRDPDTLSKPLPKIIIATIPVRAEPTTYPPIACLSIINALRKAGLSDSYFYNIDLLRPSIGEIVNYIEKEKPDILGISAVVSTSYRYVKQLSLEIKKTFPSLTLILGGVLGASAEILLKKTGIDFVCTGEGERTMVEFVRCWQEGKSKSEFAQIPGLAFLGDDGDLVVTPIQKHLVPANCMIVTGLFLIVLDRWNITALTIIQMKRVLMWRLPMIPGRMKVGARIRRCSPW